jgi:hypothetical protein
MGCNSSVPSLESSAAARRARPEAPGNPNGPAEAPAALPEPHTLPGEGDRTTASTISPSQSNAAHVSASRVRGIEDLLVCPQQAVATLGSALSPLPQPPTSHVPAGAERDHGNAAQPQFPDDSSDPALVLFGHLESSASRASCVGSPSGRRGRGRSVSVTARTESVLRYAPLTRSTSGAESLTALSAASTAR